MHMLREIEGGILDRKCTVPVISVSVNNFLAAGQNIFCSSFCFITLFTLFSGTSSSLLIRLHSSGTNELKPMIDSPTQLRCYSFIHLFFKMALFIYYLQHDSEVSAAEKQHFERFSPCSRRWWQLFFSSKFHDKEEEKCPTQTDCLCSPVQKVHSQKYFLKAYQSKHSSSALFAC